MSEPSDKKVLQAIRRVLSAAAAEMQLEKIITDEDCMQVLLMQRDEGLSNTEIIASAETLLDAEEILQSVKR